MSSDRKLSYSLAINEALHQSMAADKRVFLIGQGVKSPWYVGNTARGLLERFGGDRVIDTPVSENAVTGAAVGAAIAGMRPVVVHPRMDFMVYAFDPLINEAANWHYMSGGACAVPVVIWAIINRGGEQAAQHSQALQSIFAHIPGLKVVAPATPYDAKGLLAAAIGDGNPVVFVDDRWLYGIEGSVPRELYSVPIGAAAVRRKGRSVTVVSSSFLAFQCQKAVDAIARDTGLECELIDLRSLKPWDEPTVLRSVRKTGRLLVVDGCWRTSGFAAEVASCVQEKLYGWLKAPVRRLTLPDVPAPASAVLEAAYYPSVPDIVRSIKTLCAGIKRGSR